MGPLPGSLAGPRRAHFLRGGAPRPALGRLGRARGRRWLAVSAARFTAPRSPRPRRFPGPWTDFSRRALSSRPLRGGRGGTGPPSLPARLPTGADCPQCASTASRRQGGDRPTFNRRRQGSAAMSVAHPTRLETRTKESNARASQRVGNETPWRNESEGRRTPAEVGSRPLGLPGAPPARLARSVGEVERERAR